MMAFDQLQRGVCRLMQLVNGQRGWMGICRRVTKGGQNRSLTTLTVSFFHGLDYKTFLREDD